MLTAVLLISPRQYKITMGEVVATAPTCVSRPAMVQTQRPCLELTHFLPVTPIRVGSNNESYTFRNLKFNLWCASFSCARPC